MMKRKENIMLYLGINASERERKRERERERERENGRLDCSMINTQRDESHFESYAVIIQT